MDQDAMQYDIVIVGAGPAGLSAAIRLKQLAQTTGEDVTICVLEKGAQVGSHIMAGAVLDPRALKTLLPTQWEQAPLDTPVEADYFYYLSSKRAHRLPTPRPMKNHGNYIISLSALCRFLAQEAEQLGCEIYSGFAAAKLLFHPDGAVKGVITNDVGLDSSGNPTDRYQPGMHIHATQTIFAEGCRGELSQELMSRFNLREGVQPQTYGLGLKEIWHIPPHQHHRGHVVHTIGWPLDRSTYGGGFLYHLSEHRVAVGFVVGLDYQNPWLSPFEEFQRFKTHPAIRTVLADGERIAYGARAINEGGWQSLPKLTCPGAMLIGDGAGFLNVPKIKGIHTAMQSGIIAAETCFDELKQHAKHATEVFTYPQHIRLSWLADELYRVRNIRPGFRYGLFTGLALAAFETYITRGRSPWTLNNQDDHLTLKKASVSKKITYPKPDNQLTFDRLSSVYLSNTFHEENQPPHLKLRDPNLAIRVNFREYASPETRYCPAAVYELINNGSEPQLRINAQNCIHCKTCDIKDPRQNIQWTCPEGGGGPNYVDM